MTSILKCRNSNCSVSLFKTHSSTQNKKKCPVCNSPDLKQVEFKQGVDEFICSNPQCTEYQINPFLTEKLIFICPFCQGKNVDVIKHDIK